MGTLTVRLTDDLHDRLKALAARRGTSMNKLLEELSIRALTEADTEARFLAHAARGSVERGRALLDELDRHFTTETRES